MKKFIAFIGAMLIAGSSFGYICFTSESDGNGGWFVTYYHANGSGGPGGEIQSDWYNSLEMAQQMTDPYVSCC
jgi:hypothetical protein